MLNSQMLYRYPGPHNIHNDMYDYIIVHKDDVEKTIKNGWYKSTTEAKAAAEKPVPATNGWIQPNDLTTEEIREIFDAEGTQKEISKRFNVSTFTVHKIKKGKL